MKVLVIGASGLVGSRFVEFYSGWNLLTPGHEELDLIKGQQVKNYFHQHKPSVIINFAAETNVGETEKQQNDKNGSCWQINVAGVKNLLETVSPDTFFIQISTDMVFSGSAENPGPYSEDQPLEIDPQKLTWYGYTKAQAEELVGSRGAILRLIYPVRAKFAKKLDYLRKPLKLFDDGKLYPLFTDQQVSISFIDEVCLAIEKIIDTKAVGTFHVGSRDTASPHELITYLLEQARGFKGETAKSSVVDFVKAGNNPARYPQFGGLKVIETEKRLDLKFSSWREIIDKLIEQGIGR